MDASRISDDRWENSNFCFYWHHNGHLTHTKNMELIELARSNHVTPLVLLPHITHGLQPLDVGFMFTLSHSTAKRSRSGCATTQLLGEAYHCAAVPNTAINTFRRAGIWPGQQPQTRSARAGTEEQPEPRPAHAAQRSNPPLAVGPSGLVVSPHQTMPIPKMTTYLGAKEVKKGSKSRKVRDSN